MYESRTERKGGVLCLKVMRCCQNIDVFSRDKRCAAVGLCGNYVDHRKEGGTEIIIIVI